jgi:predicted dehydrogenase
MAKPKKNGVRLGVIGLGLMGASHAREVADDKVPGMHLTAVCNRSEAAFSAFADVHKFTDPIALMDSGLVDAVLIATPHYSHTPLAVAALERSLHVLLEKPIAVHKAECERLIAAYDPSRGQVFAAMFNQRTDPRYVKLRELIGSGDLGQIQRIQWVITDWFRPEAYYRSGGWRATWSGEGGGVLLNQCPHQLDLWQWLFGMPRTVTASCQFGRFHDIEVEDSVTAMLDHENGCQGVFVTTTGEAPGENRLSLACERGLLVVEREGLRFVRTEVPVSEFSRTTDERFAMPETREIWIPCEGRGEQHLGIMKNFAAAILDGETLIAPAVEGIHSVELANAMLLSSLKQRRQNLPINAAEYENELGRLVSQSDTTKPERS